MTALLSVIPAGALTWGVVAGIQRFTEISLPLLLSWRLTALACGCHPRDWHPNPIPEKIFLRY